MARRKNNRQAFKVGEDITHNPTGRVLYFSTNEFLLNYPYEEPVQPATIAQAFKDAAIPLDKYDVRFYPETDRTNKTKRIGGEFMAKRQPVITQFAKDQKLDPLVWVWVKAEGLLGTVAKRKRGTPHPEGPRRLRRAKKKNNR